MRLRQRAVALYFIDKLALRAGNEKDEDQADTVGCCSLRVEHITLHEEKDGKEWVVEFDFLGKAHHFALFWVGESYMWNTFTETKFSQTKFDDKIGWVVKLKK